MKDLFNAIHPVRAIAPAAATADDTPWVGEVIDRQGFEGLTFVVATGALADADATFAVLVEHGDAANLSDAAAVPDTELLGSEADAGFDFSADNATRKIGYAGAKRYVRLTVTPANNTGNAFLAAVAVLSHPHVAPTSNPPA
jgi:hypothetical protein